MRYLRVSWIHEHESEPIELYSECNESGWEVRKVEMFRDGRFGYAGPGVNFGGSMLGLEPIPSLAEIASSPEFRPVEISKEEFEQVWSRASTGASA
jgi:hypothetical protein